MSTNEMDDYELFGGEPPAPQGGAPKPRATGPRPGAASGAEPRPMSDPGRGERSTLADTAAAVARRKKEADRVALVHEIVLIGGFILVLAAAAFFWRNYSRRQAAIEKQRHDDALAEQNHQAELSKKAREENIAQREKVRKEQEAKKEAQRKEREAKKAADAAKRDLSEKYRLVREGLRDASIDYWQKASDSDRPNKVTGEATFYCLFPGDGDGCSFYEVKTSAEKKLQYWRLSSDKAAEPMTSEAFIAMASTTPYLIMRERGKAVGGTVRSYFVNNSHKNAVISRTHVPRYGDALNPAKNDFGDLYATIDALGGKKLAFKYKVAFQAKQLPKEIVIKTVKFGEEINRDAFVKPVQQVIDGLKRSDSHLAFPDIDKILDSGTVVISPAR